MANDHETARPDLLGHFEYQLMTALLMLGGEDYGVPLYDKVCEIAGKRVNQGSLYITLDRLEEKGLLLSRKSDPAKETRGTSKRFFRLTDKGLNALQESAENAKKLSEIYEQNSGSVKKWRLRLKRIKWDLQDI